MTIFAYRVSDSARMLRSMLHCPIRYPDAEEHRSGRFMLSVDVNYGVDTRSEWFRSQVRQNRVLLNEHAYRAHSKPGAFDLFTQAGLPTIEYARTSFTDGSPFLGRSDGESRGRGIVAYNMPGSRTYNGEQHDFFVRYYKPKNEYRVHVLRNVDGSVETMVYKKRINPNEVVQNGETTTFLFYLPNGEAVRDERIAALSSLGTQAVIALGLDFGAVDILEGERSRQFRILEVNTAPGFDEDNLYTPRRYANYFERYVV